MRFLFCNLNSLPPFHQSGAEITIDEFLEELSEAGHSVSSIICNEIPLLRMGEVRKVVQNGYSRIKSPYCKLFFNSKDNFQEKAIDIIHQIRPDVIISQLNFLKPLYEYCVQQNIPLFYLIHGISSTGIHSDNEINILQSQTVKGIVCVSNFVRESLHPSLKEKVVVIYPRIPELRYKARELYRDKILFFNPIKSKGIEIISHLAKVFSNEIFEVKETWGNNIIRSTDKRIFPSNVIINKIEYRFSDIYNHCKLLLIPSQIEEGYGRGIIEANINSLPVIASNIGGIPEAAGDKQYLIDDYSNPEAWIYMLEKLLNSTMYYQKCLDALDNSKRVSMRYNEHSFLDYIKQAL